jgi:hypothetical protein
MRAVVGESIGFVYVKEKLSVRHNTVKQNFVLTSLEHTMALLLHTTLAHSADLKPSFTRNVCVLAALF